MLAVIVTHLGAFALAAAGGWFLVSLFPHERVK